MEFIVPKSTISAVVGLKQEKQPQTIILALKSSEIHITINAFGVTEWFN